MENVGAVYGKELVVAVGLADNGAVQLDLGGEQGIVVAIVFGDLLRVEGITAEILAEHFAANDVLVDLRVGVVVLLQTCGATLDRVFGPGLGSAQNGLILRILGGNGRCFAHNLGISLGVGVVVHFHSLTGLVADGHGGLFLQTLNPVFHQTVAVNAIGQIFLCFGGYLADHILLRQGFAVNGDGMPGESDDIVAQVNRIFGLSREHLHFDAAEIPFGVGGILVVGRQDEGGDANAVNVDDELLVTGDAGAGFAERQLLVANQSLHLLDIFGDFLIGGIGESLFVQCSPIGVFEELVENLLAQVS